MEFQTLAHCIKLTPGLELRQQRGSDINAAQQAEITS